MKGHLCTYTTSNKKLLLSNLEINNNRKIKINEICLVKKKYIHLKLKHGLKNNVIRLTLYININEIIN